MNNTVTVIGACGHVGLPFSLVLANSGYKVYGLDINNEVVNNLNSGKIPYIENGAEELLRKTRDKGLLTFTDNKKVIPLCDVIAVMIGTPVDSENNPRLDDIMTFIDDILTNNLFRKNHTILLRSTVAPGTTELIRDTLEKKTGLKEGLDFHLLFCPERVAQSHGLEESRKLPQLIGAFSHESYVVGMYFFKQILGDGVPTFHLTPREAEFGKLITNMYRYINFAFANEAYILASKQNVDIHKVIQACNQDYPRMNMPLPGPNVGGPCLFKDGKFLLDDVPFVELIRTAYDINEGMPQYIFNQIKALKPYLKSVLILGMSFKAECDDTRNSLSYKFRKICHKNGIETRCYDPYVEKHKHLPRNAQYAEAIVVMTPHKMFKSTFSTVLLPNILYDTVIADVWKLFDTSKQFPSGIYQIKDASEYYEVEREIK